MGRVNRSTPVLLDVSAWCGSDRLVSWDTLVASLVVQPAGSRRVRARLSRQDRPRRIVANLDVLRSELDLRLAEAEFTKA